MKSDTIKEIYLKQKRSFRKIRKYINKRQIQVRTPLLILPKHAIVKGETDWRKPKKVRQHRQNIDFVTSSEGYRPLQDLNLIDDYKIRN